MSPHIVAGGPCSVLATSLARVVSDAVDSELLHEILGTYCHQSRNVLHTMKLGLFLAQQSSPPAESEAWGKLERNYLTVEHFYNRLQLVCRPMEVSPVRMPLSLLIDDRLEAWTNSLAERGQSLEAIKPDGSALGDFDPALLAQGLDAFVAWRSDVGRQGGTILLRWGVEEGHFYLDWTEPNAGDRYVSEPRLQTQERLALPLLARVVTAHAGTLDFDSQDGLRLRICWPLHVRRP